MKSLFVALLMAALLVFTLGGHSSLVSHASTPTILISPTSGPVNTVVAISGSGFTPGDTCVVSWGNRKNQYVNSSTAQNDGTCGDLTSAVPSTSKLGATTVTVLDQQPTYSYAKVTYTTVGSASADFTVTP